MNSEISEMELLETAIDQAVNVIRTEPTSSDNYHLILFLISLHSKGMLVNLKEVKGYEMNHCIQESIRESQSEDNEIFRILYDKIYKTTIDRISITGFSRIISILIEIDENQLNKHLQELFEKYLEKFQNIKGRFGGEFHLPTELNRFAFSLVSIPDDAKVYNPFSGSATFSIFLKETQSYFGQEINLETWTIGKLRIFAHNRLFNTSFSLGDSINSWNPFYTKYNDSESFLIGAAEKENYDLIISNPPIGLRLPYEVMGKFGRIRNAESFLLDQSIDTLNNSGKLLAFVSLGLLSNLGTEFEQRKYFIENDLLETVITFPAGIIQNTGIKIAIIVLNKEKVLKGKVKFVDASVFIKKKAKNSFDFKQDELLPLILANEESVHVKIINNATISENDFDLSVNQYLLSIENKIKLGEIIDNERPFNRQLYQTTTTLRRINFSDLNNNLELDYENLSVEEIKKNDFILNDSCFLLGTFNGQLKFSFFQFEGEKYRCSSNMIPLKINEQKVTVPYFAKQLTEGYFIDQFISYSKGAAIQKVSKTDLFKIVVSLPSIAEQERQEEKILRYFKETNRNLQLMASLEDQLYEQTVYLRHSIAGPTRNVLSFMKKMMLIIDNNPNILVAEIAATKLKPTDRYSFNDMRELVERDLKRVENVVKNQLDIQQQISDSKLAPMDIDAFLSEYIHNLGLVHPQINISYESFVPFLLDDIDRNEYVTINGNKELLSTMLDNLFDNARQHAFQLDTENKFLVNLGYDEDSSVLSIEVANSGKGFPKDIDFKGFIAKNKKSQESLGNGFGGWYIYQVIKHHKGNLDIDDNSVFKPEIADGYATSFHIQLPLAQE